MKTALAIVCSLMLAGTSFVPAPASAGIVANAAVACRGCKCGKTDCCVARPSPESRPVSANPVSSPSSNPFSTLAPAAVAWTLPGAAAREFSSSFASPSVTAGAPLYARNCARLI